MLTTILIYNEKLRALARMSIRTWVMSARRAFQGKDGSVRGDGFPAGACADGISCSTMKRSRGHLVISALSHQLTRANGRNRCTGVEQREKRVPGNQAGTLGHPSQRNAHRKLYHRR